MQYNDTWCLDAKHTKRRYNPTDLDRCMDVINKIKNEHTV